MNIDLGRSFPIVLAVVSGLLLSLPVGAELPAEAIFVPASQTWKASPPLPPPSDFPIQFVLDDDEAEGSFGLQGAAARQFLWFNRFSRSSASFRLEEIWVLFPAGGDVPIGGEVQLLVYLDPDGDPTNGAVLLAAVDETVQATDGSTFSVYPLPAPVMIDGVGDVLIGVINRYFEAGTSPPPTLPAALDTTASQGRSYVALWSGDPPDPPSDLASATTVALLDGAAAGNLMIRGFGTGPLVEVPTSGEIGLVLLTLLLGSAAVLILRRQ